MGDALKVFTYWDKPADMPAYLRLCLATWRQHGGIEDVTLITDENLHQWIAPDTLDWEALADYPVAQRKDAIEIAVLARHGGLFLDVDTIMTSPPHSIFRHMDRFDITLYGYHLAAVGTRAGSPVVARWLELLQDVLSVPRQEIMAATGRNYTELGNCCFELLRDELATGRRSTPDFKRGKASTLIARIKRYLMLRSPWQSFIRQLDPAKTGYIAECRYRPQEQLSAQQRYAGFWFDRKLSVSEAFNGKSELVALHHSWTPASYSCMEYDELRRDDCLLSRYLVSLTG